MSRYSPLQSQACPLAPDFPVNLLGFEIFVKHGRM